MTKSRWCRSSSRRPSTCHILSIAFGHGFAHECVARHPIPTRVRSWSRSWGGALLAISSPAWLRCPVPDEGALLCTPTPARPRPHAHARTPTPVTNRLPLYLPNCSRLPHRTPDRLLKRFVCAGWHTFATYRSANVAARPFGSQLGKCFDNRSARLFASIVCLELIGYRSARLFASIVCLELIGYCLWLWLNQSGVFAVCLTPSNSLPYILPTFFAV